MLRALCLACALFALPSPARAIGDKDKLAIAQIAYAGNWNPRPTATRRMAWEIEKRTVDRGRRSSRSRCASATRPRSSATRCSTSPATRRCPRFDDADVARLRRHLQTGGFLVIDGAEPRPGGGFDQSVRALVGAAVSRASRCASIAARPRRLQVVLPVEGAGRPRRRRALPRGRHARRAAGRSSTRRTTSAAPGRATTSASGSTRSARAATRSASWPSASASTWRCTRSASTTRPTRCTCRSSCAGGSGSRDERLQPPSTSGAWSRWRRGAASAQIAGDRVRVR